MRHGALHWANFLYDTDGVEWLPHFFCGSDHTNTCTHASPTVNTCRLGTWGTCPSLALDSCGTGLGKVIHSRNSSSNHLQIFCQHHVICSLQGNVGELALAEAWEARFLRVGGVCLVGPMEGAIYGREKGSREMPHQWPGCDVRCIFSLGFAFNCFPYRFK